MWDVPKKLNEQLAKICPKIAKEFQIILYALMGLVAVCKDVPEAKPNLFEDLEALIKRAYEECPEGKDLIQQWEQFYNDHKNIKCGGG